MTLSLPFGVLRSLYKSTTTQMLSILETGMNAPTHSTLNDGKHTWMGKPQYNPERGWTLYQWTLASSYGKSIVSPLGDQMVTVCWKKYCMIPVYKEGNILFYILNKIVLTRYTPKKSLQTFSAPFRKKLPTLIMQHRRGGLAPKRW